MSIASTFGRHASLVRTSILACTLSVSLTGCLFDGDQVPDRSGTGTTGSVSIDPSVESGTDDLRLASRHCPCQRGLLFPTERQRPRWRRAHVPDRQQARMGDVRRRDRSTERHTVHVIDRRLQRRAHHGERRPGLERARAVLHLRHGFADHRIGHAELAAADFEYGRVAADQSRRLRGSVWHGARRPGHPGADRQSGPRDVCGVGPRVGHLVLPGRRFQFSRRRKQPVGNRFKDDLVIARKWRPHGDSNPGRNRERVVS